VNPNPQQGVGLIAMREDLPCLTTGFQQAGTQLAATVSIGDPTSLSPAESPFCFSELDAAIGRSDLRSLVVAAPLVRPRAADDGSAQIGRPDLAESWLLAMHLVMARASTPLVAGGGAVVALLWSEAFGRPTTSDATTVAAHTGTDALLKQYSLRFGSTLPMHRVLAPTLGTPPNEVVDATVSSALRVISLSAPHSLSVSVAVAGGEG
jgi:hypothetical protein